MISLDDLLIDAGVSLGVRSLVTGHQSPTLQKAAEAQARLQAKRKKLGHFNWQQRARQLANQLPEFLNFREVVAIAWGSEKPEVQIMTSWKHSAAHWRIVNSRCDIWGYSMWRSGGVYFACGILADSRLPIE